MIALRNLKCRKSGFTLVEITLVVGILVVLSAIVLVTLNIRGNSATANNVRRKSDLEQIQKALDFRAQETGDSLPSGLSSGLSERCVGTGSDAYNLSQISWTKSPPDTNISMKVRSCAQDDCSDGADWSSLSIYSSSPATLNISNASHFQYQSIFNPSITPWTQTLDTDFNGTNSSTAVSGTGASASIKLVPNGGNSTTDIDDTSAEPSGETGYVNGGAGGCSASYDYCWDTTTKSTYNFRNITFTKNIGVIGNGALRINASGNVAINGTLVANGGDASGQTAGAAGAGGSAGGSGGGGFNNGNAGSGSCSGGGGLVDEDDTYGSSEGGGGGGGGFGGTGSTGRARFTLGAGAGGGGNNSCSLGDINGGSGGGGGGGSGMGSSIYGGGGGGGGGAIKIVSSGIVTIGSSGKITANGGNGGINNSSGDSWGGGGGGGSGGGIYIEAVTIANNNTSTCVSNPATCGIQAIGGNGNGLDPSGGGNGGGGRIDLHAVTSAPSITGSTAAAGTSGFGTAGNGVITANTTISGYLTSGIYTSAIKEVGTGTNFSTLSWTETLSGLLPANTPGKIKVRTCDDAACNPLVGYDELEFSSITATACTGGTANGCIIDNGGNLTSLSSAINGHGWVQYEVTLSNNGDTAKTPSLDEIAINYYSFTIRPILKDISITGVAQLIGDERIFQYTAYNHFFLGGDINPLGSLILIGSDNPNNNDIGAIEYFTGVPPLTYTSPVFFGSCYDLTADLAPLYLGTIPKDPKIGTDENTGYLISVDPTTKVVCVKAPGAENDEIIENCRR